MYIVCLPKIHGGRTQPTPVSFAVCTYVHNYPVLLHLCTNCTYTWLPCVNMYIYIYLKPPMCCKYVLYLLATLRGILLDDWGPNGPHFKNPSLGFFLSRDDSSQVEQDCAAILFQTQGPHCIHVNIYPRPLWLVLS